MLREKDETEYSGQMSLFFLVKYDRIGKTSSGMNITLSGDKLEVEWEFGGTKVRRFSLVSRTVLENGRHT